MPKSYLFQLNLDLSNRDTDPNFNVDFPSYSWEITNKNFIDQCIPSGFFNIEDCFSKLLNGSTEVVNEICRIRNQLNEQQFLPVQLIATLQRNDQGVPEIFQCFITILDHINEDGETDTINSLFEYNPQSFCYLGLYGEVIRVNKKLSDFLSVPESVLVQHNFRDFIQPNELPDAEQIFKMAKEGQANQYEFTVYVQNGIEKRVRINVFPRFKTGKVIGVYGIFEDITETEESLDRWQNLVEQCPLPITIYQDYNIIFTNEASVGFYEVESLDDLVGSNILNYIHPEDKKVLIDRKSKLQNGHLLEPSETRLVTKKGTIKYIIASSRPINYNGQKSIQSVLFDITEIRNQQILIEKSLKEKDILLKEIHHRVKNNLAIVSGLLELQVQSIKDEGTIAALKDSQNRIQSIALVHQQLYQFESFDEIHLDLYLNDLISGLKKTLDSSRTIDFKIESDHIKISIEYAIPCSLILNEVVLLLKAVQ